MKNDIREIEARRLAAIVDDAYGTYKAILSTFLYDAADDADTAFFVNLGNAVNACIAYTVAVDTYDTYVRDNHIPLVEGEKCV